MSHVVCKYCLSVEWITTDSRSASVPSVQPHEVCREPAGDDQLSHGTLPTPCETGCVFFSSVFSLQLGEDKARPDWRCAAALQLSRGFYCFWERLQKAAGEEMAPFADDRRQEEKRWQNVCRNVTATLRKTITLWLRSCFCFLEQIGGSENLHTCLMGKWVL